MVLTARPGSLAWLRRTRFWSLVLLGLVVGHQAVYLAEYGSRYDEAMARTGHGYWLTFALLVIVVGGVPIGAAIVGLGRLRARLWQTRTVVEGRRRSVRSANGPSYLGEFVTLLPRLFAAILIAFACQENAESLLAGNGLPGLHVLDLMSIQVLFAITFLVALAGAWLRWREVVLRARLASATRDDHHDARHRAIRIEHQWADIAAMVAHQWLIARRIAGRAPPALVAK